MATAGVGLMLLALQGQQGLEIEVYSWGNPPEYQEGVGGRP